MLQPSLSLLKLQPNRSCAMSKCVVLSLIIVSEASIRTVTVGKSKNALLVLNMYAYTSLHLIAHRWSFIPEFVAYAFPSAASKIKATAQETWTTLNVTLHPSRYPRLQHLRLTTGDQDRTTAPTLQIMRAIRTHRANQAAAGMMMENIAHLKNQDVTSSSSQS